MCVVCVCGVCVCVCVCGVCVWCVCVVCVCGVCVYTLGTRSHNVTYTTFPVGMLHIQYFKLEVAGIVCRCMCVVLTKLWFCKIILFLCKNI